MRVIHVYAVDCTPYLSDDAVTRALPHLDKQRGKRVARLRVPLKRAQCVCAGLLLTALFGSEGAPPSFTYGAHGKPYLVGDNTPDFSLSHSDRWVFCAVSDLPLGMDAQEKRNVSRRLPSRILTSQEADWVNAYSEPRFRRIWTMKEAYVKYTGTGLSVPLGSVEVNVPPTSGWDPHNKVFWHLLTFDGGLSITVCGEEAECADIEIVTL